MARALQRALPAFGLSLHQMATEGEQQYRLMPLPGFSPEQSDALSADYFEAWQALLQQALPPTG